MVKKEVEIIPILKRSFESLVKDPGFVGLYLLPYTVIVIAFLHMWSIFGTLNFTTTVQTTSELQSLIVDNIWWIVLYTVAIVILGLIALAAIILKATAQEKGKSLSFGKAVSSSIAYPPQLFVASILVGLIVMGPFLFFIFLASKVVKVAALGALIWFIPMIYIGVRLSLFAQTCVVKDLGPIECLGESWRTTKGNFWLIFVIIIILSIISAVLGLIPITGNLIATLVVGPASIIALTLIYLGLSK